MFSLITSLGCRVLDTKHEPEKVVSESISLDGKALERRATDIAGARASQFDNPTK